MTEILASVIGVVGAGLLIFLSWALAKTVMDLKQALERNCTQTTEIRDWIREQKGGN